MGATAACEEGRLAPCCRRSRPAQPCLPNLGANHRHAEDAALCWQSTWLGRSGLCRLFRSAMLAGPRPNEATDSCRSECARELSLAPAQPHAPRHAKRRSVVLAGCPHVPDRGSRSEARRGCVRRRFDPRSCPPSDACRGCRSLPPMISGCWVMRSRSAMCAPTAVATKRRTTAIIGVNDDGVVERKIGPLAKLSWESSARSLGARRWRAGSTLVAPATSAPSGSPHPAGSPRH